MQLLFSLGSVVFFGTEVPEQLYGLGGREALAVHEFPGGTRTAQPFGAFPTPIHWAGVLTGTLALPRSIQIDRLRVAGTTVQLIYGLLSWKGYVESFVPEPKHEWFVPYKLVFQPVVDLSGATTPPSLLETAESAMSGALNTLSALQQGVGSGLLAMPFLLVNPVASLLGITSGAMSSAQGGKVSGIPTATAILMQTSVAAVQAAALPLLNLSDATQASPAIDVYNAAGVIGTLVATTATAAKWTIHAVNPNLWLLAAQYLGDATRWQEIAKPNGLTSPLQLGTFQLGIPAP